MTRRNLKKGLGGNPAILSDISLKDRRLCVPALRQVCQIQNVTQCGMVTLRVKRGVGESVHICCNPVIPVKVL